MNLSNGNIPNFNTKRLIRLQFIGMEKNKVVLKILGVNELRSIKFSLFFHSIFASYAR